MVFNQSSRVKWYSIIRAADCQNDKTIKSRDPCLIKCVDTFNIIETSPKPMRRDQLASHIPFITGDTGAGLVGLYYPDSEFVRVVLDNAARLCPLLPKGPKLWIDPAVDGMDNVSTRAEKPWHQFMASIAHFADVASPAFQAKPVKTAVEQFVKGVLDRCMTYSPDWITVPQLPLVTDSSRNKINRMLAGASASWKTSSGFKGKLILPLVFTNQKQINLKTDRNHKVKQAKDCFGDAKADGIWTVDKTLNDDNGSPTLHTTRFPAIVALHQELNAATDAKIRIAGPYWGMNLVLWARGLVDYPAIGVGSGYQYFMAGGHAKHPAARIAIPFLRRLVDIDPALRGWLDQAIPLTATSAQQHGELVSLRNNFNVLRTVEASRRQIAEFYKQWFNHIGSTVNNPDKALFQDLAEAYVHGAPLPDLPDAGTARRPGAVAHSLMLSCL